MYHLANWVQTMLPSVEHPTKISPVHQNILSTGGIAESLSKGVHKMESSFLPAKLLHFCHLFIS